MTPTLPRQNESSWQQGPVVAPEGAGEFAAQNPHPSERLSHPPEDIRRIFIILSGQDFATACKNFTKEKSY